MRQKYSKEERVRTGRTVCTVQYVQIRIESAFSTFLSVTHVLHMHRRQNSGDLGIISSAGAVHTEDPFLSWSDHD